MSNILDTKDLPQIAGGDIRLDALVEDHPIDWDITDDERMEEVKRGDKAWHDEIYAAYEEWSVEQ